MNKEMCEGLISLIDKVGSENGPLILKEIYSKVRNRLQAIELEERYGIKLPYDTDYGTDFERGILHLGCSNRFTYPGYDVFLIRDDSIRLLEGNYGWLLKVVFTRRPVFESFEDFFNGVKALRCSFIDDKRFAVYWSLDEAAAILKALPRLADEYGSLREKGIKMKISKELKEQKRILKSLRKRA